MAELKLGSKYECYSCGVKFYDLGKGEPVCPKCGANQEESEQAEAPVVTEATRRRREPAAAEESGSGIDELDEEELEEQLDEELGEEMDEEAGKGDEEE